MGAAAHNLYRFADDAVALHTELQQPDGPLSVILCLSDDRSIMHDIRPAIVVEQERRVNAVHLWQIYGVAPPLMWVFGLDIEISTLAHVGGYHIEGVILSVIADGWRIDAARHPLTFQLKL